MYQIKNNDNKKKMIYNPEEEDYKMFRRQLKWISQNLKNKKRYFQEKKNTSFRIGINNNKIWI